jgi:hypothetical protein
MVPWHTFLLAAYPVLFVYAGNVAEVNVADVLVPLLVLEAVAAVAVLLLTLLFRDPRRAGIVVSTAIVVLMLFYPWSDGLRQAVPRFARFAFQEAPALGLALGAIVLAGLAAWRLRARLRGVTTALNVIAAVLAGFLLIQVLPDIASGATSEPEMIDRLPITAQGPGTQRDIYYIVLDRYGSERSIGTLFGIEDNDFDEWLTENGFQVLKDAHANYVSTTLSLASTLNLEYLSTLIPENHKDVEDFQSIFNLLQDHRLGRFLRSQGYEYVQVGGWFGPTREARIANENLHPDVLSDFAAAVVDNSALPLIAKVAGLEFESDDADRHAEAARYQFDAIKTVTDRPGPTFLFAHILMPHPPYVFDEDGTFLDPRVDGPRATYATQLRYTNQRMKEFLEPLLALPEEERPIVIIQADEGPYPKRNGEVRAANWTNATADELEEKYGILSAFLLPGDPKAGEPLDENMSSVNTFRMLLDRYWGTDLPPLENRSWVSKKAKPYDMIEITDRLPSLQD